MASAGKGGFTSRWGLILAALGAAIGTGNIWRFPMKAAMYGGGSFLIPWLLFLFIWSIPLLMAEFALGKATRMGTIGTFKKFVGKKFAWMGAWMVFVTTAINFYYAVVMGWVLRYFMISATGNIGGDTHHIWAIFIESPLQVVFFQALAVFIGAYVVYRGIAGGIEKANMILIPTLFVLLIFTAIWALTLPNAITGFVYLFTPQVDANGVPFLLRGDTWIEALAQSAWSCSAGMGMAITYAVYMKKREDTNLNPVIAGLGNSSASLIIGIAVFSTVFALSANPQGVMRTDSTALTFIHLTNLFNTIPMGYLLAGIFFLAMSFAALTSLISGYEIACRNFMDAGFSRPRAIKVVATATFILGLPSATIIGYIHGEPTAAFLENQDNVWGLGLILSGLFVSFAVWKYGAERFRQKYINTEYSDLHVGKWWTYIITYVFPVLFTVLIAWYIVQTYLETSARWWASGPIGLLLLLLQWGVVIFLLLLFNNRIANAVKGGIMGEDGEEWRSEGEEGEEVYVLE